MATAATLDPLRGSCTCGRIKYAILLPSSEEATATAQQEFEIFFDDRTENAYLRVPIARYQSFTTAFYPDETHSSIRRTFTPEHAPTSQQIFCGLCGTHLSHWSEFPSSESQHLNISLSTMTGRDLGRLEDLGVLRPEVDDAVDESIDVNGPFSPSNAKAGAGAGANLSANIPGPIAMTEHTPAAISSNSTITRGEAGGMTWIQAARRAGGLKTRKGIGKSRDGKTVVEWEVSEYTGELEAGSVGMRGKRKLGEGEEVE